METNWGQFEGEVHAAWSEYDPRVMRITRPLRYVDSQGVPWYVQAESVVNGASTGWFFRRLFPAFVGFYRRATVFHDVYCESRDIPSPRVHRMFYEAMRCDIGNMAKPKRCPKWCWELVCGVRVAKAGIMWAAVRCFGPRFKGKGQ